MRAVKCGLVIVQLCRKKMRHLIVFLVVYGILVALLPHMELELLKNVRKNILLYAELQNFVQIRTNAIKACCLLCIWPFAVHAGPVMFVELGCFSMACFAIACLNDIDLVRRSTSKLFWHSFCNRHKIRTPGIIAWYDKASVLHISDRSKLVGVRKPDRGMYGLGVHREEFAKFCSKPVALDILQCEVTSSDDIAGRSYRICTFRSRRRATRVISVFVITLRKGASIDPRVWNKLVFFGTEVLSRLHDVEFTSVPLIGWDVMHDDSGELVVLEGNLGGSVGIHIVPFLSSIGSVDHVTASTWVNELRDSFCHKHYNSPLSS